MPLRAFIDGQEIIAPLLDDAAWERLRERVSDDHLRVTLPCCDVEGYLRRSKAGTKHFAHKQGAKSPDCPVKAETVEHLRAKADIILACHAAGFAASSEVAGDGWRADVLASRGSARIAFEVQWSFLRLNDALYRQRRYARDGIRGCWFFRRPPAPLHRGSADVGADLQARHDLPLFQLYVNATGSFSVALNGRLHALPDFVTALLQGNVRFCENAAINGPTAAVRLAVAESACPQCRRPARVYTVDPTQTAGCGVRFLPGTPIPADHPVILRAVEQWQATPEGRALPLASLRPVPGASGPLSLAFHCPHCGALFGPPAGVHGGTRALQPATTLEIAIPARTPVTGSAPHWCYPYPTGGPYCCARP